MDRKEKILHDLNRQGLGLEIGPSHNPIAPKKDGFNVHVIDHMSKEELITKYRDHPVNIENIEDVDFVWKGESYQELTQKSKYYDWIISSHSIEHTPDLIGFLKNCDQVLKDNGLISLAIPDKRYCFDHFRPITGLGKIIDSHIEKKVIHSAGDVAEFLLNFVTKGETIAWGDGSIGEYLLSNSDAIASEQMQYVMNSKAYVDVHAWCFVPHSFRLVIHDLYQLGFIPFQEVNFFPTAGCEFFVTLGRKGKTPVVNRLDFLKEIENELKVC